MYTGGEGLIYSRIKGSLSVPARSTRIPVKFVSIAPSSPGYRAKLRV